MRAGLDKEKAEQDAAEYRRQYNLLSEQISALREQKRALLDGADLPLAGCAGFHLLPPGTTRLAKP